LHFPWPSSCSCSRHGGTIDSGRPRGKGKRRGGLDGPGGTGGGSQQTGSRSTVIVILP